MSRDPIMRPGEETVSTAAVIWKGDTLLLVKRPPGGDLGGLWELPGGKVDPGETPEVALERELEEELGIRATVGSLVASSTFTHHGRPFRLLAFNVSEGTAEIRLHEHEAMTRCTAADALDLDLAPSDIPILQRLAAERGGSERSDRR